MSAFRVRQRERFPPTRDPAVGVRVGAVVVDELGAGFRDVRGQAGDPFQVVEVLVLRRDRVVAVVVAGSLGKVAQLGLLHRAGEQSAGRGRAAHHVEPHADGFVDVGDLVSGERV